MFDLSVVKTELLRESFSPNDHWQYLGGLRPTFRMTLSHDFWGGGAEGRMPLPKKMGGSGGRGGDPTEPILESHATGPAIRKDETLSYHLAHTSDN